MADLVIAHPFLLLLIAGVACAALVAAGVLLVVGLVAGAWRWGLAPLIRRCRSGPA
ncbi:hypothetical protein AB0P17_15350 [Streptomyces sp. NPDC088124]|uniref:hypothetical protein n=1 Tax=Streptomyces sp. NPDC088124 TaxID=3154654 RepID=UPI0034170C78